MTGRTFAAVVAVAALTAAACTGDSIEISFGDRTPTATTATAPPTGAPSRNLSIDVEPVDTGQATAAGAMRELCVAPTPVSTDGDGAPDDTPADVQEVQEVQEQVEQVRERDFLEPVVVQPVTAGEIAAKLEGAFDDTYPKAFYDRRTVAWQTIGVLPRSVSIREALLAFQTGQVVGFYNPVDGELVYRADGDLDLVERATLAHELTHAIDDQHFDLDRIDRLVESCRDEAFQAALGAVEGSAQFFSIRLLIDFPPAEGDVAGFGDGGGPPDGVPPFMADLQLWPYTAGQAFVTQLDNRGGIEEIDGALERFPVTTEQLLHPERFPGDAPASVDVSDLSNELGPGWGDLDVMQIGEAWLAAMLTLRLDSATADAAAAGWDGGVYRAFTDSDDALVVFDTAWDTQADADAFEQAVREWLGAGETVGEVARGAEGHVTFAMATDEDLLPSAS